VVLELPLVLVVLVVVEVVLLHPLELVLLVLLILVVAQAAGIGLLEVLAAQAVPALSSCPTPCQKAQSFNSCLLQHGKHQQAFLLLTTW
jgi:hypothetical protein